MTRWLETDSLSNQDISSALAIGAYTADADRLILVQFFADQVAGNGDYVFYVTLRVNGAGSSYQLVPTTTAAVASGVTAIGGQSAMIAVRSGDVVTVYLDGLAGDNANPDTTVRWFELAALRPTTADRTLDVSSGGEAGVDWANIGGATTTVNLSGTTVKTATDVETDTADIQGRLPAALVSGRISASVGEMASGVITHDAIAEAAIVANALDASTYTSIGDAVHTELATELAHLDEDVSAGAHAGDAMTLANDAITAAALAADAVTEIAGAILVTPANKLATVPGGAVSSVAGDVAGVSGNVYGKVLGGGSGTITGTGVQATMAGTLTTLDAIWAKIQKWLRLGYRKDAFVVTDHATELAEINVNTGSGVGTYTSTTDSIEAQRDNVGTAGASLTAVGDTRLAYLDAPVSEAGGGTGLTAQETRDAMKLAPTAGSPAAGSIDAHLDSIIATGVGTGTGTYTDTVTDGVDPLDNVLVQLSTDAAGANMVYRTYSAANGTFTMHPDPGTYYVWFELAGYSFTQGAQVVVT